VRLYSRPGNDLTRLFPRITEAVAYRSGRSPDWIKLKNPKAPAVKREAEEDWKK
jgi:ATP-dependent DNA ligase